MIRNLLYLYMLILIADAILSYLPQFRHHPVVQWIRKAADFTCKPVRQLLPPNLPFDISPLIVILALRLLIALW